MIAALRPGRAAVLRETAPQRGTRSLRQPVRAHTNDPRPCPAVRADLTRLEKQVDAARGPALATMALGKMTRSIYPKNELIQQSIEADKVPQTVHQARPSQLSCSPMRMPSIGIVTVIPRSRRGVARNSR